jgi:hypothetical protein
VVRRTMTTVAVGFACGLLLMLSACSAAQIERTTLPSSTEFDLSGMSWAEKLETLQGVCRARGIDAYGLGDPFDGRTMTHLSAEFLPSSNNGLPPVMISYTSESGQATLLVRLYRSKEFDGRDEFLGSARVVKTIPSVGGSDVIYQTGDMQVRTVLVAPRGETTVVVRGDVSPGDGADPGVDGLIDAQAHLVALGR